MSAKTAATAAPGMFHQLISAFVNVEGAERDRVYKYPGTILRTASEPPGSVARFVEPTAEAELGKDERAREVLQSEAWNDHAGAIYSATTKPSFALGFALAYRLLTEKQ